MRSKQQMKVMIMGFDVTFKSVLFFGAIVVIGFPPGYASTSTSSLSTPAPLKDSSNNNSPPYSMLHLLSPGTQNYEVNTECVPIRPSFVIDSLPKILSLDIFSQADPFNYFLTRTKKLTDDEVRRIHYEVHFALKMKKLHQCYTPFAKLLYSFSLCWVFLLNAKPFIKEIKIQRSANIDGFNSLPNEVSSSSELSELFSSDIFSDPEPPLSLFTKILNMQERTVVNSKNQLQNFMQKWADKKIIPFPRVYISYADAVFRFLRTESVLENLKLDLDEIKRIMNNSIQDYNHNDPDE
ncbi:uncharacterized protein LOC135847559 [Planococcus citri]|uniref:uncharacterized protein LOC135847559 n=1 Tax=Planococcus citri TaxID=170843 RepID=UPI0031F9A958